jgi:hypothetical protein
VFSLVADATLAVRLTRANPWSPVLRVYEVVPQPEEDPDLLDEIVSRKAAARALKLEWEPDTLAARWYESEDALAVFFDWYQKECVGRAFSQTQAGEGVLFAVAPGLGKTRAAIAAASLRSADGAAWDKEPGGVTLVVVPASIKPQWLADIQAECEGLIGAAPQGALDVLRDAQGRTRWILVSYSALTQKKSGPALLQALAGERVAALILDEVHVTRTPSTKLFAATSGLVRTLRARCRNLMVMGLTGTPVVNRISDLCSAVRVINAGCPAPTSTSVGCPPTPDAYNDLDAPRRALLLERTVVLVGKEEARLPPLVQYRISLNPSPSTVDAYYAKLKDLSSQARGGSAAGALLCPLRLHSLGCWSVP